MTLSRVRGYEASPSQKTRRRNGTCGLGACRMSVQRTNAQTLAQCGARHQEPDIAGDVVHPREHAYRNNHLNITLCYDCSFRAPRVAIPEAGDARRLKCGDAIHQPHSPRCNTRGGRRATAQVWRRDPTSRAARAAIPVAGDARRLKCGGRSHQPRNPRRNTRGERRATTRVWRRGPTSPWRTQAASIRYIGACLRRRGLPINGHDDDAARHALVLAQPRILASKFKCLRGATAARCQCRGH